MNKPSLQPTEALAALLLEILADSDTDVDGDEGVITHYKFIVDYSHMEELCKLAGFSNLSHALDIAEQE